MGRLLYISRIMVGEYMSTYGFVGHLKLEEVADKVLGKNWEAEDDVSQIQEICDHIDKGKYSVYFQEGIRHEHDIIVRETDNHASLKIALAINKSNLEKMEWYDLFVDYVQEVIPNLYNEACDYANKEELSENGLTAEEIKEYYLNTGNPDYEEEPYKSYTDTDWIECANLNDLER